jgi:hypothetical protein
MDINLKSHNLTDLSFWTKITLTEHLAAEIAKVSKPDSEGDYGFHESYEKHRALAWVFKPDDKTFISDVGFMYEVRKGGKKAKSKSSVSKLISLLSTLDLQLTFDCRAAFQFSKKQRVKSIVPLPQKPLDLPNVPFDRIQGMHLVKLDGTEIKYDVFLESQTRGSLAENILFKHSAKFNNNLANSILKRAVEISDKFILKD